VEADRAVAMAAGWLSWPGGSRLEDARTAGAGSLIARLLPRGSASIDGDALAREIEGRAALLDGFSGHSSAGLHFECLAGDARHVLERALDCALAPTLLDAEFERERALELESLAAERDDFAKLAILTALAGLYGPKHPYHQRRRGTAASLRALDGAVLRDRWAQWYPPGRMVVAVCGDVDPEMVIETVRAAVPPGKAPPRRPQWPAARVAARPAAKVHRRTGRGRAQTHVAIAMPGLPIGDARMATLDLMSAVLGGATGRLFMALREREGLVYHASAGASQGVDAGHLMVVAATSPSKLARAQTAIDAELARMMDELVPAEELDRVRTGLLGQYAADFERRARIASAIAFDECFGLGARAWREYPARLARVRPRDVQKLARELMLPRRRAAVVIG
jgi:zinc protease